MPNTQLVTDEMIEAGAKACNLIFPVGANDAEALRAIYTAMHSARQAGVVEKSLMACVAAMQAWIHPDGISDKEFHGRILEALDNPEINPAIAAMESHP